VHRVVQLLIHTSSYHRT